MTQHVDQPVMAILVQLCQGYFFCFAFPQGFA